MKRAARIDEDASRVEQPLDRRIDIDRDAVARSADEDGELAAAGHPGRSPVRRHVPAPRAPDPERVEPRRHVGRRGEVLALGAGRDDEVVPHDHRQRATDVAEIAARRVELAQGALAGALGNLVGHVEDLSRVADDQIVRIGQGDRSEYGRNGAAVR